MSGMHNCHVEPIEKQNTKTEYERLADGRLLISGMGCPSCAGRVRNSLLRLDGVVEAAIDHNTGVGHVTYDPTVVSAGDLEQAVSAAGGDGHHEYIGKLVAVAS